jgi:imidazolonepropionase-like amidohydrolase
LIPLSCYSSSLRPSYRPKIKETFAKAYKKGVPIGFGTDAAVFLMVITLKIYLYEARHASYEGHQAATIILKY